MPNAEFGFGAVSVDGEIYVIGHNFTYVFDPSIDSWVSRTPIPSNRQGFATAACQNKIYVIGGWNSTTPNTGIAITLGTNEMYDPATDAWTTKRSMPTQTADMEANTVDDKIYVISGLSDISKPTLSSSNWVYDPSSDSWSTAAPIPTSVFDYVSAVVNNKIYVEGGGLSGSPYYSDANQIYDPKTDNWTLGVQMPTARLGLAVAVLNDSICALGGVSWAGPEINRGTVYALNEQYLPLDYQGPTPSPYIPIASPRSTNTPTPTPKPSPPNFGPTSSPTPSPSIPEFQPWTVLLLFSLIVTTAGFLVYFKKANVRLSLE